MPDPSDCSSESFLGRQRIQRVSRARTGFLRGWTVPFGVCFAASALFPLPGSPQDSGPARPELNAKRVAEGAVHLDGRLSEEDWASADVAAGFTQRDPDDGSPATERTEFRILYSAAAIYIGVRAFDSERGGVRSQLVRRDGEPQADYIRVFLDSYRDRRSCFEFAVASGGSIRDASHSDDSSWGDTSWDPVWEAATAVDSLGWSAEFRIPFTQLRFDREGTEWGLQVHRHIERKAEDTWWAPYSKEGSGFASRFGVLRGLSGLPAPRRMEVQPYAVTTTRMRPESGGSLYAPEQETAFDAGVDLKYGLTSDFTLDMTVNPDFGQVEADPAVVNLTAFESYFPERRPFFVEGNALFDRYVPAGQLFYSRRIGRPPPGSPSAPEGGTVEIPDEATVLAAAKVTGKTAGGTGIGILSAVTTQEKATVRDAHGVVVGREEVAPWVHHFAGRVEQDFREGSHTVGGMVTAVNRSVSQELDFLRSGAYMAEVDGQHRWYENKYRLSWTFTASQIRGSHEAMVSAQRSAFRYYQRPDANHVRLDSTRISLSGYALRVDGGKQTGAWRAYAGYERVSPGFDINDMGFQWNADFQDVWANAQYVLLRPRWVFRNLSLSTAMTRAGTTGGEVVETWFRPVYAHATFTNNWSLGLNPLAVSWDRLLVTALRGGPALRENTWRNSFFNLSTDSRKPVSVQLWGNLGGVFGTPARFGSLSPWISFRHGGSLSASVGVDYSQERDPTQWVTRRVVDDSTHYVLSTISRKTLNVTTRVDWTFSSTMSLQLYAQPYVAAGAYDEFKDVADPKAAEFGDRFRPYGEQLTCGDEACAVDLDGDGSADFSFGRPDFNYKSLRATVVLRWEYRPGSVLYLAWQHRRAESLPRGSFRALSDLGGLFSLDSENTLLVKANYWLAF